MRWQTSDKLCQVKGAGKNGCRCPVPKPKRMRTRTRTSIRIWTELNSFVCLINLRGRCESVGFLFIFSHFWFFATILLNFPMTFRCNLSHNCCRCCFLTLRMSAKLHRQLAKTDSERVNKMPTLVSAWVYWCHIWLALALALTLVFTFAVAFAYSWWHTTRWVWEYAHT